MDGLIVYYPMIDLSVDIELSLCSSSNITGWRYSIPSSILCGWSVLSLEFVPNLVDDLTCCFGMASLGPAA
jgi:hypothetical protein